MGCEFFSFFVSVVVLVYKRIVPRGILIHFKQHLKPELDLHICYPDCVLFAVMAIAHLEVF